MRWISIKFQGSSVAKTIQNPRTVALKHSYLRCLWSNPQQIKSHDYWGRFIHRNHGTDCKTDFHLDLKWGPKQLLFKIVSLAAWLDILYSSCQLSGLLPELTARIYHQTNCVRMVEGFHRWVEAELPAGIPWWHDDSLPVFRRLFCEALLSCCKSCWSGSRAVRTRFCPRARLYGILVSVPSIPDQYVGHSSVSHS